MILTACEHIVQKHRQETAIITINIVIVLIANDHQGFTMALGTVLI